MQLQKDNFGVEEISTPTKAVGVPYRSAVYLSWFSGLTPEYVTPDSSAISRFHVAKS